MEDLKVAAQKDASHRAGMSSLFQFGSQAGVLRHAACLVSLELIELS